MKLMQRLRGGGSAPAAPVEPEREHLDRLFRKLARHTRTVEADCGDLAFLVDTSDRSIGGRLFVHGHRPEMALLQRAVDTLGSPGGVFVDAGANIGTTSIPALARHGFDRGLAIEPAPRNVELLRLNAIRNGVADRLMVEPVALGDAPGEATLVLSRSNSGAHRLRGARPAADGLPVPVVTLADVLARHGVAAADVGLLWIDVQGFELEVLAGASEVRAAAVPVVLEIDARDLERGGMQRLQDMLATYDRVLDLRAEGAVPQPLSELCAPTRGRYGDVLVFRSA